MISSQNVRGTLHSRRSQSSSKVGPLTSRKSSSVSLSSAKKTSPKSTNSSSKTMAKREVEAEADEDDMAGLPQFCATCEKQIVTPSNSVLYCSESCRKKDHNKPLEESILPPDLSPQPQSRRTSYFGDDALIEARSPPTTRPPSLAFSDSSDSSSLGDRRSSYTRNDAEAAHYLSQFMPTEKVIQQGYRQYTTHSTIPSLSHTPGSLISASGSYRRDLLPRRSDPFSASFSSFSVDLITPVINNPVISVEEHNTPTISRSPRSRAPSIGSIASTETAFRPGDDQIGYEKKIFSPSSSVGRGSLRQLFLHNAMQAAPRSPSKSVERTQGTGRD